MTTTAGMIFAGLAFFWGASLGSFVNVLAFRIPLGRSIVRPDSACPACGAPIRWYFNIPVFGYLLTRGACADCRTPISLRYPLVELAAGLGALAFWLLLRQEVPLPRDLLLDLVLPFALGAFFIAGLLALTLIDLDWFLLPDRLTLPFIGLGLVASVATPRAPDLTASALGALLGGLVPAVIMWLYLLLTGRDGMGGGDWKFLAGIGAWCGLEAIPFVLGAAAVQGLATALLFRRDFAVAELPPLPGEVDEVPDEGDGEGADAEATPFLRLAVPFGPFLALAAFEWLYFGPDLLALAGRH